MAYYSTTQSGDDEKTLAYDLRQLDAVLTSEIKRDLVQNKKNRNYYEWFKNIQDLYDQVGHYLKDYEETTIEYFKKIIYVKQVINQNASVFLGNSKNPVGIENIENVLRELERWVYKKMYDAGMFGFRYEDDGL